MDWRAWQAGIEENLARDPFHIGWRYEKREESSGMARFDKIPLRLEDLLNVHEEDRVTQMDPHWRACYYLSITLKAAWPRYRVWSDHLVDWNTLGVGNHSPDTVVFHQRRLPRVDGGILRVENRPANLVMDVTYVSTLQADFVHKLAAIEAAEKRVNEAAKAKEQALERVQELERKLQALEARLANNHPRSDASTESKDREPSPTS